MAQNNTNATLDIDRIELTPGSTRITFHAYYIPKWWIKVSPDSHITLPDGTNLGVTGSKGSPSARNIAWAMMAKDFLAHLRATARRYRHNRLCRARPSQWSIKGISVDMAR